jgi:hypothetical protein
MRVRSSTWLEAGAAGTARRVSVHTDPEASSSATVQGCRLHPNAMLGRKLGKSPRHVVEENEVLHQTSRSPAAWRR